MTFSEELSLFLSRLHVNKHIISTNYKTTLRRLFLVVFNVDASLSHVQGNRNEFHDQPFSCILWLNILTCVDNPFTSSQYSSVFGNFPLLAFNNEYFRKIILPINWEYVCITTLLGYWICVAQVPQTLFSSFSSRKQSVLHTFFSLLLTQALPFARILCWPER